METQWTSSLVNLWISLGGLPGILNISPGLFSRPTLQPAAGNDWYLLPSCSGLWGGIFRHEEVVVAYRVDLSCAMI